MLIQMRLEIYSMYKGGNNDQKNINKEYRDHSCYQGFTEDDF